MEKRKLTCIGCPMGCQLEVGLEGGDIQTVTGNICKRGDAYARKEVTNPTRIVTTTVRLAGGGVVPVKTKEDIPKETIMDCVRQLKALELQGPVEIGQVILEEASSFPSTTQATVTTPRTAPSAP